MLFADKFFNDTFFLKYFFVEKKTINKNFQSFLNISVESKKNPKVVCLFSNRQFS